MRENEFYTKLYKCKLNTVSFLMIILKDPLQFMTVFQIPLLTRSLLIQALMYGCFNILYTFIESH